MGGVGRGRGQGGRVCVMKGWFGRAARRSPGACARSRRLGQDGGRVRRAGGEGARTLNPWVCAPLARRVVDGDARQRARHAQQAREPQRVLVHPARRALVHSLAQDRGILQVLSAQMIWGRGTQGGAAELSCGRREECARPAIRAPHSAPIPVMTRPCVPEAPAEAAQTPPAPPGWRMGSPAGCPEYPSGCAASEVVCLFSCTKRPNLKLVKASNGQQGAGTRPTALTAPGSAYLPL
jgi:hypothetical protein